MSQETSQSATASEPNEEELVVILAAAAKVALGAATLRIVDFAPSVPVFQTQPWTIAGRLDLHFSHRIRRTARD